MLELDKKVKKMPTPEVIKVLPNSRFTVALNENFSQALTLTWQWVLANISEALITRNAGEVFELLFSELDYVQLNHNAIEDVRSLLGQPVDENVQREITAKISTLKQLMGEYLKYPQTNVPLFSHLFEQSNFVVQQLKSLDVVGVGAFMLASGFRLALLLELAASERTARSQIKFRATEDSNYAFNITPKLFRLSIAQIDKACQCRSWESTPELEETITHYECRYFDGKDIHLFRGSGSDVLFECNKHRLLMFQTVAHKVNQTAATPVRAALKKWRELANSIQETSSHN